MDKELLSEVRVGIASENAMVIRFNGDYQTGERVCSGYNFFDTDYLKEGDYLYSPLSSAATFTVCSVSIGKDFHWQQRQDQTFRGKLLLRCMDGLLTVINILPVEWYLESVISSEMSPEAPLEFLKAHAVISRSWLLAQIKSSSDDTGDICVMVDEPGRRIKWYDHTGHTDFDVCADDHCQRYQGIGEINDRAHEAVEATRGEVLTYKGEICDARFSKCCGGAFETFENCWQSIPKGYLQPGADFIPAYPLPDLKDEEDVRRWILSSPDSFCSVASEDLLNRVLRNYDRFTRDYYRWSVEYTAEELATIVKERSGVDFGEIINLIPLERGESGRITLLRIIGSRHSMIIGKELEIRRILSHSHLYSSAFIIERVNIDDRGVPSGFIFHGAGWGHGVGMCQIGAAVMATQGYSYRRILSHYYPGSQIEEMTTGTTSEVSGDDD